MEQKTFENSEKANLLINREIEPTEPNRSRRTRRHFIKGIVIAGLLWWSWTVLPKLFGLHSQEDTVRTTVNTTGLFDFSDITPSEKLEWHSCQLMGEYKCARLTVPMDYHRPLNALKDNPKVHLALLMVPGKSKNRSTSPLLLNPGGPGGSGVLMAASFGWRIHSIVGPDQDVIGFDPRGIGSTTPRADCFSYPREGQGNDTGPDPEEEDYAGGDFHRMLWNVEGAEIGLVNSSTDSLKKLDYRARTLAKLCQEKDAYYGDSSIFRYAHTPSVARDMLSIVDAWDEWTASLKENSNLSDDTFELEKQEDAVFYEAEGSSTLDTKGKLVYWGFSYGTLLGATFASMFPDRVGRIILDGVVDADHYVAPVWADSIMDADTISESFNEYCHQAKEKCAIYRQGDEIRDIKSRIQGTQDRIKDNPISFIDPKSKMPVILEYDLLKSLQFMTLYSPTGTFPLLAQVLDSLYRGDIDKLRNILFFGGGVDLQGICAAPLPAWVYRNEAQSSIMCSDKRYPLNETLPNLEIRFEKMANLSSFADVWMGLMVGCDAWGIKAVDPPMRWDDHPAHKLKPIKTSFPVLFISNTADPVTPLAAGMKMAKKFVDAGLIEQKCEGHCSLAAVSKCTIEKVRAYFVEGKVPGTHDMCEADEWPFHQYNGAEWVEKRGVEATAEAERMTAQKEMQEVFQAMKLWGSSQSPSYRQLQTSNLRY